MISSEPAPATTVHPVPAGRKGDAALLALVAVLYLPLVFFGFGSDNDAYLVLESGERIVEGRAYEPSRPPGYFLHEAATGMLDRLGGSVATNLGTVALALLALASFTALCERLGVPHRLLLGVTFALHPLVWASAASTMDYLWALGFGLAGGVALLDRRWAGAGVLFGLAFAARFTSVIFVASFLAFALWRERPAWRGPVAAGAVAAVLGALWYLPTLGYYGGTLDFLTPAGAEEQALWTWAERLGRFGYKNIYFWGLPAAGLLAALVVKAGRRVRGAGAALGLAAAVVLGYEVLFLRYPLEPEYLLPIVPFVLIALGLTVERRWLVAFCVLVLSYGVVSINVARPDRPNQAQEVEVGLWLEPGYLVTDVAERLVVRGCRTHECWLDRSANGTFPNAFGD